MMVCRLAKHCGPTSRKTTTRCKQLRIVQAWIELHRDELLADWELAQSGEQPYKIAPL